MSNATTTALAAVLADQGRKRTWFAARCGVTTATVRNWCSGATRPSRATREFVADLLGVSVETAWGDE